mmetsp:Transcript_14147/g.20208  ORF Transcript_14147/g.20208 Transcript_14147/m.20208 type:complete len:223 (-) Transcript_14147:145-813(-)|eukprot:CAMPEP_0184855610 /NCGR_PEP_ID=MMETSP0580-20130426/801_1 /TAXON_ID=1118495 /ORGANISM="Dactyliosolen fragilissimus" /LENGTH=222 /DNA_ID=CAMNT_0027350163 /DNA_START=76 /DNA_END=744 /DNA_ORIENTATION=-
MIPKIYRATTVINRPVKHLVKWAYTREIVASISASSARKAEMHLPDQTSSTITVTKTNVKDMNLSSLNHAFPHESASPTVEDDGVHQNHEDAITITASTINQISSLATRKHPGDPSALYLRIYVDSGGCSGFQYKFELENDAEDFIDEDEDVVITASTGGGANARVVIDESSLEYIRGSTVDYVQEMIRSSFAVIDNPQSESACGCGSSFAIKNFESNPAID